MSWISQSLPFTRGYQAFWIGLITCIISLETTGYAEQEGLNPTGAEAQGVSRLDQGSSETSNNNDPQTAAAKKATWTAWILRDTRLENRITHFNFPSRDLPVLLMPKNDQLRPLVTIRGDFERPGWELYTQDQLILRSEPGKTEFRIFAYLKARINEVLVTAKGPNGEVETERLIITAPGIPEIRITSPWGELFPTLGVSYLSYLQTGVDPFHSLAVVLSADYRTPKWNSGLGLLGSISLTTFTLSSRPKNYYPQFTEWKIDGSYSIPSFPHSRMETTLFLGMRSLSMIPNNSPFGFANLMSPELGFRTDYLLPSGSLLTGSFRFAPIGNFSGGQYLIQRALEGSIAWSILLPNLHKIRADLTLSDTRYHPESSSYLGTTLFYFRVGYNI